MWPMAWNGEEFANHKCGIYKIWVFKRLQGWQFSSAILNSVLFRNVDLRSKFQTSTLQRQVLLIGNGARLISCRYKMTLDTLLSPKRLKTKNISSSHRKTHSRQTFEEKGFKLRVQTLHREFEQSNDCSVCHISVWGSKHCLEISIARERLKFS